MDAALDKPRGIAIALLLAATALLWQNRLTARLPQHALAGAAQAMPAQLGSWQGRVIGVEKRVVEILETDAVSLMEYRQNSGQPVWLAHVAGFGNRAAFHPPELCYVGSHYEVLERGPIDVVIAGKSRRFMRLVIAQDKQRFEAWYWFTANERVTHNYYWQQFWLLMDTVQNKPSSGTLVRISTPMEDAQASYQRLLDFTAAWESGSHG